MTELVTVFALSAGMVAHATGGRLAAGAPEQVFDTVTTDTRALAPGALFIALQGPRFDGHAFVDRAIRDGAAGVLVSAPPGDARGAAVIVVPDTLEALQRLGRDVRRRSGARVVAITGSAGKTTTKEVTATLLEARYTVFRNPGNLNNHIGLPLSLIELRRGADVAVVELGMNHAGEIRRLVEIAEPEVRVWTNVGDAHIGFFGTREAIAEAKAEILEAAAPATLVVANADDPLVRRHVARWTGRRLLFGEAADADVRAERVVDRGFDGSTAAVATPAGTLQLRVPLPGRAFLHNVLAAVAVATDAGVDRAAIVERVARLRPVARRGEVIALPSGARVVDDSYNASPAAVHQALQSLAATDTAGRRVAVLGEMLELGDQAYALHVGCGQAAVEAGVDLLVAVGGPAADGLIDGARAAGLPPGATRRFADSAEAADALPALVAPGDLVLVKGSRGTRTDLVVDRLKEAC